MVLENKGYGYGEPRPVGITIICILGFVYSLLDILSIFIPEVSASAIEIYTYHYPIAVVFFNLLLIISYLGLWRMKLWGLILYVAAFISLIAYGFFIYVHFSWTIIPSLAIMVVCLLYTKEMD